MNADSARTLFRFAPGIAAAVGAAALAVWLSAGRHAPSLPERIPEPEAARPAGASAPVNLAGVFVKSDGLPAALPGAWPSFRGPRGDNVSAETGLARAWGPDGPTPLWSADLGEGHAGAAVLDGRVFVLDYDQAAQRDALRCLSLEDGREIWRRSYPVKIKRNHGMSRTVPAVTARYVVSIGPKCHVLCCETATGKYLWGMDLVRQYRTKVPPWYAGQCPLIDGDRVILAPGGDALMIAVDAATGKVLWKAANPKGWGMSHASILPLTFGGRRMYVYCAAGGVVGVDAGCGALLWQTDAWKISIATVPTPVPIADGRLFLSGGYNSGAMILDLKAAAGGITPEVARRLPPTEFGSDQQTPVFYKGYLYGVIPGGEMVCLDPSGRRMWRSGSTHRFGIGPYLVADGMIYVMNDSGLLTLVEASPEGYKQLAQSRVLKGHDSWGPLALAGGRLLARDLKQMVCLDVGAQ